jgi:hypothetical protein
MRWFSKSPAGAVHITLLSLIILNDNKNLSSKQEVLGRTNGLLSLIRHAPYAKPRLQQIFCGENIFTEPLPSNDRGVRRKTHTFYIETTRPP